MTRVDRPTGQDTAGRDRNVAFFRDNGSGYAARVARLRTYRNIHDRLSTALAGTGELLDVGNGGVFNYDPAVARRVVAVDLFADQLDPARYPGHVEFVAGSALDLPFPGASFDGVVMAMLLHHLVGRTVADTEANLRRAVAEAVRVLRPGGRVVVVESCVPPWFYRLERRVYPVAAAVLARLTAHPATLQFPPGEVADLLRSAAGSTTAERIPVGGWVLQFGVPFPSPLTPVQVWLFVARKPTDGDTP
jgi:SAM-dependent methyltransferase